MASLLITVLGCILFYDILFPGSAYGGSGMGGAFGELSRYMIIYGAIGLSASIGSIVSGIRNSRESSQMRNKIVASNLSATGISIFLFGMVSILVTAPEVNKVDFWIFFLVIALLAILSSQAAQYAIKPILHKYGAKFNKQHTNILISLVTGTISAIVYFTLGAITFIIAIYFISEGYAFRSR